MKTINNLSKSDLTRNGIESISTINEGNKSSVVQINYSDSNRDSLILNSESKINGFFHGLDLTVETVRAKFKCNTIMETEGGSKEIKMMAVMDDDGENGDFNKYTPSGDLSIWITPGTKANSYFEVGKEYYLDFSKA